MTKHTIMDSLSIAFASLMICVSASAQSTNPLNYSGKMYVSSIEVITTPRYISFEDHAILSSEMTIPAIEITKVMFDFENNIINLNEKDHKVKVTGAKKYTMTDGLWTVVIYINFLDDTDKYELVWREYGNPYFQEITKTEDGVKIAKMNLSSRPSSTSPEDALLQFLGGLSF